MLVRLDRIELTDDQLDRPIPSLAERQFVVAKVKRSADEERLERALFWYREELLRRVQLRWSEVGSLRSGEVSLRGLALDEQTLDTLRGDEVEIELFLAENPCAAPGAFELQGRGSRLVYSASANEFIDVCARVTNRCGACTAQLICNCQLTSFARSDSPPTSTPPRAATARLVPHLARGTLPSRPLRRRRRRLASCDASPRWRSDGAGDCLDLPARARHVRAELYRGRGGGPKRGCGCEAGLFSARTPHLARRSMTSQERDRRSGEAFANNS